MPVAGACFSTLVIASATRKYAVAVTAPVYQSRFDELRAKGFYPVHISTELGRYAAIWTR
ncbi:hypothetical protein [Nonomuraea sp. NPDC049709]|uniref:hypothetical protein n=1 Tax=Nonomuraea sp. NPDC049709 TaxID=3154736 RepID=UPI00344956D2